MENYIQEDQETAAVGKSRSSRGNKFAVVKKSLIRENMDVVEKNYIYWLIVFVVDQR